MYFKGFKKFIFEDETNLWVIPVELLHIIHLKLSDIQ